MNPYALEGNSELLEYLKDLAQRLRSRNCVRSAEEVERAQRFANGSPSEFLHEAQLALRSVERAGPEGVASCELMAVIEQIDKAFHGVGGA